MQKSTQALSPPPLDVESVHIVQDHSSNAFVPRASILVSVRNAAEFELVLQAGVHWIDLKEPQHGSLGCPHSQVVNEILERFEAWLAQSPQGLQLQPSRPRLSIALGDLEDGEDLPLPVSQLNSFAMVKVGYQRRWPAQVAAQQLIRWQAQVPHADRFVLVHYPDLKQTQANAWNDSLAIALQANISSILIDTLIKDGRSTLQHLDPYLLSDMIDQANKVAVDVYVAGSLRLTDLATVWRLGAKIIGIRSAVCVGNSRVQAVDAARLQQLASIWS